MLAVGAEAITLILYLISVRDGVVDPQEERFSHAAKRVMHIGLLCVIISGVIITVLEFLSGSGVVFAPTYIFKCVLIGIVLLFSRLTWGSSLPEGLLEGFAGGTWFAIFVVHIFAAVATWMQLLMLYSFWMGGFMLCWIVLVFSVRGKPNTASVHAAIVPPPPPAKPKEVPQKSNVSPVVEPQPVQPVVLPIPPQPQTPPVPKVEQTQPVASIGLVPQELPTIVVEAPPRWPEPEKAPEQPIVTEETSPDDIGLPAVWVMPKKVEDIGRSNRGSVVKFD